METFPERLSSATPAVRIWLFAVAFLVFCMVLVGGATRLTDSGLSITEWRPILGAIPPLTEADWLLVFEKYKLIPEYSTINAGMSLSDFKFIYWWEWSHRFLGRFIGVAFLLPFLFFALTGRISRVLWPKLILIFVLGALQGALGWYMVASGLVDRVDVSQYRLSAHLTLAAIIYGAILWVAFGIGQAEKRDPSFRWGDGTGGVYQSHPQVRHASESWHPASLLLVILVLLQIAAGAFVAGLDAGMGYNTWPLMEGKFVPDGLTVMEPLWRNFFENALTVQFDHRMLAYLIAVIVVAYAVATKTREAQLLLAAVFIQIGLGIWALLWQVPLWLGLVHQGGALAVLAAALWNLHTVLSRSPVPDRQ